MSSTEDYYNALEHLLESEGPQRGPQAFASVLLSLVAATVRKRLVEDFGIPEDELRVRDQGEDWQATATGEYPWEVGVTCSVGDREAGLTVELLHRDDPFAVTLPDGSAADDTNPVRMARECVGMVADVLLGL